MVLLGHWRSGMFTGLKALYFVEGSASLTCRLACVVIVDRWEQSLTWASLRYRHVGQRESGECFRSKIRIDQASASNI